MLRNNEVDGDGWHVREGDEENNDQLEAMAAAVDVTSSIPTSLKATLQFGYEDSMRNKLCGKDFDSYIQTVMTHCYVISVCTHFQLTSNKLNFNYDI